VGRPDWAREGWQIAGIAELTERDEALRDRVVVARPGALRKRGRWAVPHDRHGDADAPGARPKVWCESRTSPGVRRGPRAIRPGALIVRLVTVRACLMRDFSAKPGRGPDRTGRARGESTGGKADSQATAARGTGGASTLGLRDRYHGAEPGFRRSFAPYQATRDEETNPWSCGGSATQFAARGSFHASYSCQPRGLARARADRGNANDESLRGRGRFVGTNSRGVPKATGHDRQDRPNEVAVGAGSG